MVKINESDIKKSVFRVLILTLMLAFAAVPFSAGSSVQAYDESPEAVEANIDGGAIEGGAYEVTAYTLNAIVNKDHSYDVEEIISVDIPDQLQSIEFAIPGGNFRISDVTVDGESYGSLSAEPGSNINIADADKLSPGTHEYNISYRIREYRDEDKSMDIFYYNVLPPDWKQPIGKVEIEVSFPADFPFDDLDCYAGQFGVQDSSNKIAFKKDTGSRTVSIKGKLIPENYGITLKAQLENGYWTGALSRSWAFISTITSMALVVLILTVLWLIGGRDPKTEKKKVTKPIEGFSPVEFGYAYSGHVSIRDVIRMLIEFGIKGYLSISEYEPKKYRIYRREDPDGEERMYRNAYNVLFEDVYKDRAIETHELIPRLELIKRSISDDVASGFASPESSAFTPISEIFRYIGVAVLGIGLAVTDAFSYIYAHQSVNYVESVLVGIITIGTSLVLCKTFDATDSAPQGTARAYELTAGVIAAIPVLFVSYELIQKTGNAIPAFAVIVASSIAIFLLVIMRARGKENSKLITELRQLRQFIYHPTPKELLENHLENEDYYYEMLLYALAFGAEESWAISFLTLDVKEAEWFTNDIEGEAFSNLKTKKETVDYARDIKSFIRTVTNEYNDRIRHSTVNQ